MGKERLYENTLKSWLMKNNLKVVLEPILF